MATVVNLHLIKTNLVEWANDENNVYIGREHRRLPGINYDWGNPSELENSRDATLEDREKVKDDFRVHLRDSPKLLVRLEELRGKNLGCWCDPLPCHGTVIQEFLNALPSADATRTFFTELDSEDSEDSQDDRFRSHAERTSSPNTNESLIPDDKELTAINLIPDVDDKDTITSICSPQDIPTQVSSNSAKIDRLEKIVENLLSENQELKNANMALRKSLLENTIATSRISSNFEKAKVKLETTNENFKNELDSFRIKMEILTAKVNQIESDLHKLNQYGRRNNIELIGVPNWIHPKDLEGEIINFLKKMGLDGLTANEIEGCHWMKIEGEENRRVIVRFVNRKRAEECILKRKNINSFSQKKNTYWIEENICPAYRNILDKCETLKDINKIDSFWFYKGCVHIRKINSPKPIKIFSDADLNKHIPYVQINMSSRSISTSNSSYHHS